MNKNYNFERKPLRLPEYGRHIHEMVDYLRSIHQREERNRQAHAVIAVMGNLNPVLRDTAQYTHKLWDHLFIMADFALEVDSPYPIPTPESLFPTPERLPYPRHHIRRKHFGYNVQRIVRTLEQADPGLPTQEALGNLVRFMRAKSFEYNEEHPSNDNILKELRNMAEGSIHIDQDYIDSIRFDDPTIASLQPTPRQKGRKQQSGNNNKKGRKRRRG